MSKPKTKRPTKQPESDSSYFLKMVLYVVVGSQWLFLVDNKLDRQFPVPVGLIIGLIFVSHEHFRIDRKIEYAILLVAMLVGFWSHVGLYVTIF